MPSELVDRPARFAFGPFVLVPGQQLLLRDGQPVRIGGRALELLSALVERPGEVLGKRALITRVWPDTVVDESNLKVNVAALRRALGDTAAPPRYIATVVGTGYRFVGSVATGTSSSEPVGATTAHSHNLPTLATQVFGRDDVIADLRRDLAASRIVSIVGAGGIGKTTVALAVAEQAVGTFADGVWLIELALLRDPELVPNAIATAIGLASDASDMLVAVCNHLRDREALLVLDSCEHILPAAAAVADRVLAAAAGVRVLVTSREPLVAVGEQVRRLPGLATPPATPTLKADEALGFAAVQLFVDRATERLDSFALSDDDAPTVAALCRSLDGLALAIELAATRIDAFGVSGLSKQLDDRFRLLTGRRAGPERHRTLTATLDWSYGLLSAREATLLRAASVFAGVFDIDGASAVARMSSAETADTLAQLAAKSLLATDIDADGVAYRLLETTRTYCIEQLRVHDEDGSVRRRHAEYVCAVLERAGSEWAQRPARAWGSSYGRLLDDLRGALAWAVHDAAKRPLRIRLTVAGLLLWNHFSLTQECRAHVARAIEELEVAGLPGTVEEMKLQAWFGTATMFTRGLTSPSLEALRRSLAIAERLGDVDGRVGCLHLIGVYELFRGEHDAAVRTLDTLTALVGAEVPTAVLEAEAVLGIAELFTGRLHGLRQRFERRHALDRQDAGDARRHRYQVRYLSDRIVDVGNVLSHVQWLTGSPDAALRTAGATVTHALGTQHHVALSTALSWACPVHYLCGHLDACAGIVDMLEQEAGRHGFDVRRPVSMFYRAAVAGARDDTPAPGAVEGVEHAIAEFNATGHLARMPFYLGVLAELLVRRGSLDEAERTVRTALDRAHAKNERWCLPEIVRVRASVVAAMDRTEEAEALLADAMTIATAMGAHSWRLRAANDLAALWRARGKAVDARAMLLPVFQAFTEGHTTRDLAVTASMLGALGAPA